MKYGKLEIIEYVARDKHGKRRVRCQCECGNTVVVNEANLFNGRTKSCGCLKRERAGGRQSTEVNRPSTGPAQANNQSGVRGVSWHKQSGKWQAHIQIKGVKHFLGLFDKLEDAAKARAKAEETKLEQSPK